MTTKPMKSTNSFYNFMDTLVDEIIAMPDDQVLEGRTLEAVRAHGMKLLQAAKTEAGRRRLAAGKQGVAAMREHRTATNDVEVQAAQARRYLSQVANDPRYTLAARSLGELSDEEVLRLYRQMKSVEAIDSEKGTSK